LIKDIQPAANLIKNMVSEAEDVMQSQASAIS